MLIPANIAILITFVDVGNPSLTNVGSWTRGALLIELNELNESVSHSISSNSLQPHGWQPASLLCPWNSPGKNIGVDSHSGIEPRSPALQVDSLLCARPGKSPHWARLPLNYTAQGKHEKNLTPHSYPLYRMPWC